MYFGSINSSSVSGDFDLSVERNIGTTAADSRNFPFNYYVFLNEFFSGKTESDTFFEVQGINPSAVILLSGTAGFLVFKAVYRL